MGHGPRGLLGGRRRAGSTSRTTTRAAAPTAGARTGCSASATARAGCASRSRCGTGADPILKERLFGLTGPEGNHGEDVKEAYFYLDSTPTHSYMKALYKYPQRAFPYDAARAENRGAASASPSSSSPTPASSTTGATSTSSPSTPRPAPDDILIRITVANRGPEAATLHLLPTLWFRNTWSWGRDGRGVLAASPSIRGDGRTGVSGRARDARALHAGWPTSGRRPRRSCSSPRTRPTSRGLFGAPNAQPYVKDAFHAYVVDGRAATP